MPNKSIKVEVKPTEHKIPQKFISKLMNTKQPNLNKYNFSLPKVLNNLPILTTESNHQHTFNFTNAKSLSIIENPVPNLFETFKSKVKDNIMMISSNNLPLDETKDIVISNDLTDDNSKTKLCNKDININNNSNDLSKSIIDNEKQANFFITKNLKLPENSISTTKGNEQFSTKLIPSTITKMENQDNQPKNIISNFNIADPKKDFIPLDNSFSFINKSENKCNNISPVDNSLKKNENFHLNDKQTQSNDKSISSNLNPFQSHQNNLDISNTNKFDIAPKIPNISFSPGTFQPEENKVAHTFSKPSFSGVKPDVISVQNSSFKNFDFSNINSQKNPSSNDNDDSKKFTKSKINSKDLINQSDFLQAPNPINFSTNIPDKIESNFSDNNNKSSKPTFSFDNANTFCNFPSNSLKDTNIFSKSLSKDPNIYPKDSFPNPQNTLNNNSKGTTTFQFGSSSTDDSKSVVGETSNSPSKYTFNPEKVSTSTPFVLENLIYLQISILHHLTILYLKNLTIYNLITIKVQYLLLIIPTNFL